MDGCASIYTLFHDTCPQRTWLPADLRESAGDVLRLQDIPMRVGADWEGSPRLERSWGEKGEAKLDVRRVPSSWFGNIESFFRANLRKSHHWLAK